MNGEITRIDMNVSIVIERELNAIFKGRQPIVTNLSPPPMKISISRRLV